MPNLPWLGLAIASPLLAWLISRPSDTSQRHRLRISIAAVVSMLFSLAPFMIGLSHERWSDSTVIGLFGDPRPLLAATGSDLTLMALSGVLCLIVALGLPSRDLTGTSAKSILLILAGSLLAVGSNHLLLIFIGWFLTTIPVWQDERAPRSVETFSMRRVSLFLMLLSLGAATALIGWSAAKGGSVAPLTLSDLSSAKHLESSGLAFGLLMLAVFLRKGIFPFHTWLLSSLEHGSLGVVGFFFNVHLGAALVAKVVVPLMPAEADRTFTPLGTLALLTAAFMSVSALAARNPRRILALLTLGEAAFVLTGLESGTPEGISGGLLYLVVVSLASSALFLVTRSLEARLNTPPENWSSLGVAKTTPRLAVFFAIAALSLVGLPATLGFCAEDLLLSGTLESYPILGAVLPIATALNAITLLRLFARLFLGAGSPATRTIMDALPRERFALTVAVLLLILSGIFPQVLITAFNSGGHHYRAVPSLHSEANEIANSAVDRAPLTKDGHTGTAQR